MTSPAAEDARVQRLEAAARWLQRMSTGGTDEHVVDEWLEWCQRDPQNQQAFDDMAAVWELGGRLGATPADAAHATSVDPPSRWRRMALAASLGALALTAAAAWWWVEAPRLTRVITQQYASPIGINTAHTLADGSRLELGAGTRVTVTIAADERRVDLHDGELFVMVRKDAARPFLVDAGLLEVQATGTAFNVLRTSGRTTVTVTEGSVDARYEGEEGSSRSVPLRHSEQLVYPHGGHSIEVRDVKSEDVIAWRNGQLSVNGPLVEVIATLNRYTSRSIVIEDARVAAQVFSGVANAKDVDGLLQALQLSLPVVVRDLPGGRRLIAPRPGHRTD